MTRRTTVSTEVLQLTRPPADAAPICTFAPQLTIRSAPMHIVRKSRYPSPVTPPNLN
jgi:hypothetical protein